MTVSTFRRRDPLQLADLPQLHSAALRTSAARDYEEIGRAHV